MKHPSDSIEDRRQKPWACYDCGNSEIIELHHVLGRGVDPGLVVRLCPTCHAKHHRGMLLWRNKAALAFERWEAQQGQYTPWAERLAQLDELGYVPMTDGWEQTGQAQEIAWQLYETHAQGLLEYLKQTESEFLYPGWQEA